MTNPLFSLAQPFITRLDPETAHGLAIQALKAGIYPRPETVAPDNLAQTVFGLKFANPVGIAAGFDKNAEVPDAILGLGMGFAEVGTLTPLAQSGNPRPRIFRLKSKRGVINRLGFNNDGHGPALQRLQQRQQNGIVGVNIGANKDTTDKTLDYVAGIKTFAPVASYFTVNISSPNTPGLRGLQQRDELDHLLAAVLSQRDACAKEQPRIPVLVKIAPDLNQAELEDIVEICLKRKIDGAIISNTTITRDSVQGAENAGETGGLSGAPLFKKSTAVLARFHVLSAGKIPLIGVGGIDSAQSAYAKITAGATLVQLYTGLIYEGVGLVGSIISGLSDLLARDGYENIADAVGTRAEEWSTKFNQEKA